LCIYIKFYFKHFERHSLDIDPSIPSQIEGGAEKISPRQLERQELVLPMAHPTNKYKL
jgi:hypothetical protein